MGTITGRAFPLYALVLLYVYPYPIIAAPCIPVEIGCESRRWEENLDAWVIMATKSLIRIVNLQQQKRKKEIMVKFLKAYALDFREIWVLEMKKFEDRITYLVGKFRIEKWFIFCNQIRFGFDYNI